MQLVLFKNSGFVSRMIRWFSWGEFSHAALLTTDGKLLESREFKGVQELNWFEVKKKCGAYQIYSIKGMTPAKEATIVSVWPEYFGKKYDYRGVLGFLTRTKAENDKKYFCSELVAILLGRAGIRLTKELPHQISPSDLAYSMRTEKVDEYKRSD